MSALQCGSCRQPLGAGATHCASCGTQVLTAPQPAAVPPVYAPPVQAQRSSSGGAILAVAIGAIIGLLALMFLLRSQDNSEIVADTPIGPAGGTVPIDGGGKIDVPKGAVKEPQRVIVKKTIIRRPMRVGNQQVPAGQPALVFGPNIDFGQPVTLTLNVSPQATGVRVWLLQDGRLRLGNLIPANGGVVRIVVTAFRDGGIVVTA